MNKEPLITVAGIVAAVGALLAVAVAFGLPITEQQSDTILAAIPPVAAIVLGIIGRRLVTPNRRVVEHERNGKVVSGEGSELPTGRIIRSAGSLNEVS